VPHQDQLPTPAAIEIRPARPEDLPALVRIYNHYVADTHITFDTEAFAVEARRPWLESFAATGPHRLLVAAAADGPVGYASSTRLRPKPAYARSVETTIYLTPDAVGRGLGRALYGHLLAELEAEPAVHRGYGGIALPNPASIALHERLGFTRLGTYREVGFKLGRYWDVCWYERDVSGAGRTGNGSDGSADPRR
jgi:phosphinothricin acetyltransferase